MVYDCTIIYIKQWLIILIKNVKDIFTILLKKYKYFEPII